jgi:hypothetical protein
MAAHARRVANISHARPSILVGRACLHGKDPSPRRDPPRKECGAESHEQQNRRRKHDPAPAIESGMRIRCLRLLHVRFRIRDFVGLNLERQTSPAMISRPGCMILTHQLR